ncbi:SGNH hydrolase domain-containing protein [Nocardioides litoris]|uniref:SGNH hydrolase domain-containing protein n=1 Tax=Nocardioides litoris TaxID=1926648 RepID=UPI001122BE04|nr:SGNH hydrolase domain-containing protein [Nocardioides litoris]
MPTLRGLLAAVLAAVLAALLLATVSPVVAAPHPAAAAPALAPGEDFPVLPARCVDERGVPDGPCRVTRFPGRPTLVLWGDSHAQMYLPAVHAVASRQRVNLVVVVYGGCPTSLPFPRSAGHRRTGCDRHNVASLAAVRRIVRDRPRTRLLLGGFWSGYRLAHDLLRREERTGEPSGLTAYRAQMARLGVERSAPMARAIARLGVPVDVLAPAATVPLAPPPCAVGREPYRCDLPRAAALRDEAANRRWVRRHLLAPLPGRPRLVDPSPAYCDRRTCRATVRGVPTWYDDIHLGAALAATLQRFFRPVVRDLLRQ